MIDLFHLVNDDTRVFVFSQLDDSTSRTKTFLRPPGAVFYSIFVCGGGGGGGGGFSAAAGNARGGGGGGTNGPLATIFVPADSLPDRFYITLGIGGSGGSAGNNGTFGGATAVFVDYTTANPNRIILSGVGGQPGNGGTGAAGGAGGTGSAAITISSMSFANLGGWTSQGMASGGNGGAQTGAAGQDIQALISSIFCPGAGGAGVGSGNTNQAGGNITANGIIQQISGGAAGSNRGGDGFTLFKPLCATGGAGGGSNGTGVGGDGGNGGICCGGGGGGGGTTGGSGGRGGGGLCIIVVS